MGRCGTGHTNGLGRAPRLPRRSRSRAAIVTRSSAFLAPISSIGQILTSGSIALVIYYIVSELMWRNESSAGKRYVLLFFASYDH